MLYVDLCHENEIVRRLNSQSAFSGRYTIIHTPIGDFPSERIGRVSEPLRSWIDILTPIEVLTACRLMTGSGQSPLLNPPVGVPA